MADRPTPQIEPAGFRHRDTRLDVFRALALLTIFINHVPGQYLEYGTTKNFGFSDSAEVFVLLSGLSVGLAYGDRFLRDRLRTTIHILRRAFTLYVAHIMTSVMTFAIFAGGALWFARPDLLSEINLRAVVDHTEQGLLGMVLLGHQFGYNNILSMYAVLFLMLPAVLRLHERGALRLLVLSGGLWLLAGVLYVGPSNILDEGIWFLNPLSWQFLFVIGIVAAIHLKRGGRLPRHPALLALAVAYLLLSFCWVVFRWWHIDLSFGLPAVLTGFDKTFLSVSRLAHVLALAYVVSSSAVLLRLAARPVTHPLAAIGRHSLPVFIFGTLLAMVGQVLMAISGRDPWLGTAFVVLGLVLHALYARYLDWLDSLSRSRPMQADPVQAPAE
jgi:hypothetical protein